MKNNPLVIGATLSLLLLGSQQTISENQARVRARAEMAKIGQSAGIVNTELWGRNQFWSIVTDSRYKVTLNAYTGRLYSLMNNGLRRRVNSRERPAGEMISGDPAVLLIYALNWGMRFGLEADAALTSLSHSSYRGDSMPGDRGGYYGAIFNKMIDGYPAVDKFAGLTISFDDHTGDLRVLNVNWEYDEPRDPARLRISREQAIRIAGPIAPEKAEVKLGWGYLHRTSNRARLVYRVRFNQIGWSGEYIFVDAETGAKGFGKP